MSQKDTSKEYGHKASKPSEFSLKAWLQIAKRTSGQIKNDHVPVVSAGIAFYFFLALFPALAAVISIYGLIVDPAEVEAQIAQMSSALPQQSQELIRDILNGIAGKSEDTLEWSLIISIAISLISANRGTIAVFEGINIAYRESNDRNLLQKYGITLLFTLAGILIGIMSMVLVIGFPALAGRLGLNPFLENLISWLRWPLLALIIVFSLGIIYQIAPYRKNPEFRWVSWGAAFSTGLWLLGSLGFSVYVENLGNYDKTYGSFAALIILMLWFFLTAFIILIGAEINSEMEHQTSHDTTTGKDKPMGERGAYVADHVANMNDKSKNRN